MPRVVLVPTRPTRAGVARVAEADGNTTDGHVVANTGRTVVTVRNADGAGAHSVTFVIPGTVDGQAVSDRTVSIPASTSRDFGGFPTDVYSSQMAINVDSTQLKLQALEP